MIEPPKDDVEKNRDYRTGIRKIAGSSPRFRKYLIERSAQDILFYINSFVWTHDTELSDDPVVPFITWPAQEKAIIEIVKCARERRDLVIEKSRRQGGSWLSLIVMEWIWHFQKGRDFLMMSRDASLVDDNTPRSLFWKIRFLLQRLPEWLCPNVRSKQFHITNEDNESTMTGESTTTKTSVGARAYIMFVDEFGAIDEARSIYDNTADTCKCRIFNSTHYGTGTCFYDLTQRKEVKKLILHWSENPACNAGLYRSLGESHKVEVLDTQYKYPDDFNFVQDGSPANCPYPGLRSPWYDKECERRGSSRAVALHLDINPTGGSSRFFEAIIIHRLIADYCREPVWTGDIFYDPDTGRPRALVRSPGGPLRLWCHLRPDGGAPLGQYCFGVDVGQGQGATPSVISGVNGPKGEKVLEYASAFVDPKQLGYIATALGWFFKDQAGEPARLCWEQQGPGATFAGVVLGVGYGNCYFNQQELPFSRARKSSDKPGWHSRPETVMVLLTDYRAALAQGQFVNRSEAALKECLSFRYNNRGYLEHDQIQSENDPSGARINHGDRVIADALAWKMAKELWQSEVKQKAEEGPPLLSLAWRREYNERQDKRADEWADEKAEW